MDIQSKPQLNQYRYENGRVDYEDFNQAVADWERYAGEIPEVVALVPTFRDRMSGARERYHWVFEIHDDRDLAVMLAEAGGDVDAALLAVKQYTDLMNEIQSNYY